MRAPEVQKLPRRLLSALSWTAFGLGLFLQFSGPPLLISDNHFVLPEKIAEQSKVIDPAEMVGRFRRTRVASAILTMGGVAGLAFCYRQALFRRRDEGSSSKESD